MEFVRALLLSLKAFDFCLDDVENALPPTVIEILHDVTFLRVLVKSVQVWLRISPSAFLLSTDEINFTLHDLANDRYSHRISLSVPGLTLACVDEESAQRQRGRGSLHTPRDACKTITHAYISTDISLTVFGCKHAATEKRNLQQQHVKAHDFRTGRAAFLLQNMAGGHYPGSQTANPFLMSAPSMPPPLYGTGTSIFLQ